MTTGGNGMTVIVLLDIAFVPALPGLLHRRLDAEGAARLRIQLGHAIVIPRQDVLVELSREGSTNLWTQGAPRNVTSVDSARSMTAFTGSVWRLQSRNARSLAVERELAGMVPLPLRGSHRFITVSTRLALPVQLLTHDRVQ